MAEAETKLCGNCNRQISTSNFMMHEMHCRRHISMCQYCKEPIPKGEMEVHVEESHAKIACQRCGVQVEKMHLEDHEENSCEKRPQKCLFCDLEFPKNEVSEHTDYCGSRTEPCAKCGQYIMLKDQIKHDETNCAFPPVKPSNNGRNAAEIERLIDRPFNIYGHSNKRTARNEFDRLPVGRPSPGDVSVPYVPSVSTRNEREARANRTTVVNKGKIGKNVNTRVEKKSDLNKKREAAASGQSPSAENDYDHLLAMHLAQDLNQDDDIDELIRRMEKPEPAMPQSQSVNTGLEMNKFSEDLSMIPCEFCGMPFLADDLVQHQSGCSLDRISAMLPQLSAAVNREDGLNNRTDNNPVLTERPPIIDNLRNFSAEDWIDDTDPIGATEEDSMLLPCEFCDELFPMDILVQHQAVCDSNTSMTPRVQSPAVPKPRPIKKKTSLGTKLTNLDRLEADLPNLTSRRHQAPPGILPLDRDSDDDNDIRAGATHRVLKPNTGSGIAAAANVHKISRKPGIEPQDKTGYLARHLSHSRNSGGENIVPKRSEVLLNKHKVGSDIRTRSTLDNLLDDADESSRDLLGNIPDGGRKMVKNDVNISRQRVGLTNSTRPVPQLRGTQKSKPPTGARDVNRETNSYASQLTTNASRNRIRAGGLDDPPFEIRTRPADIEDRTTAQRPRARANHVFGAQPRQQKRRTENS